MSVKSTKVAKGRRASGVFVPFPCEMLSHLNFAALTPKATKLLFDLAEQLRMKTGGPCNNGDLGVYWRGMKPRGWKSKETLWNAVHELEHYGFIRETKQGGLHSPTLFAMTWWVINECGGKLDVRETRVASNEWKEAKPPFVPARRKRAKNKSLTPIIVLPRPDSRTNKRFSRLTMAEITASCPDRRTNYA